ncbi:MAG: hypothetical protein Q8P46_06470 [Hyphomicrobiales bacterium]|nr:hypothetical protein [Hyphomicrobiales bacterium]
MNFKLQLDALPRQRLEAMAAAADEILEAYRVLRKANTNVVGQVLAHQGTFYEEDHYPKGDVYDEETKSQYYYHAHRPETGEHGHFHTFVRFGGIPASIEPVPYDGPAARPLGKDAICHLTAISMNGPGFPVGLFTVNRWVTGETFYSAADTLKIAERFKVDHVYPCLAVNRWITAVLRLFRPQLEALLIERDRVIAEWARRHNDRDVYEDRELETISSLPVNVEEQIAGVHRALR